MPRICLIGAGSAVFWASWIRDLGVMESAPGSTVLMVDLNKERLDAAYDVATRYVKELGIDVSIERTTDRRKALEDADFVMNTAFGGHDYSEGMRLVGEKHGYYRGIDSVEFNFVSDYFTILGYRQYQLALDITSDMEEKCPDAWLIQLANPVFEVTTLLHRERPKVKMAGFCPEYHSVNKLISAVGMDAVDADFQVTGVNHCIWLTRLRSKSTGKDMYPLIDEWVRNESEAYWRDHDLSIWQETLSPASVDMYKIYGRYPIGDTTRSFTWKYHYDLETSKRWFGPLGGTDSEVGTMVRLDRFQKNADRLKDLASNPDAKLTGEMPPSLGHDQFAEFIDAVSLGVEKKLELNVPNHGKLPQLPDDITVEVPLTVSKGGKMTFEEMDPFPKRLLNFVVQPRVLRAEWGLEAFTSGSKEMLVENLVKDPRSKSERQARETIDEILALPGNEAMARHYR